MTAIPELPPQSRISSRIVGNDLVIAIPRARRLPVGGITVLMAFLGITFSAQGFLTHNSLWSIAGLFFLMLTALAFMARVAIAMGRRGEITLTITSESLAIRPDGRSWKRLEIAGVRAEPPVLNLYLGADSKPVTLLANLDSEELEWVAAQISTRLSLKTLLPSSDSVR